MKTFLLHKGIPTIKFSMLPDGIFYEGKLPEGDYALAVCPTNEKQIVVDIDCKPGKTNGYSNVPPEIYAELIQSYHYYTKSGGMHIFLNYSGDKVLLNTSTKLAIDLRIGANKETNNAGGYVKFNGTGDIREHIHLIKTTSPELNLWLESLFT